MTNNSQPYPEWQRWQSEQARKERSDGVLETNRTTRRQKPYDHAGNCSICTAEIFTNRAGHIIRTCKCWPELQVLKSGNCPQCGAAIGMMRTRSHPDSSWEDLGVHWRCGCTVIVMTNLVAIIERWAEVTNHKEAMSDLRKMITESDIDIMEPEA